MLMIASQIIEFFKVLERSGQCGHPNSNHRNIPEPSNCIQTFIRGLVMMRYNLKITFSLKCHPHIPRVIIYEPFLSVL